MRIRPGVEFASLSDVGCVRKQNEDSSSYWEPESEQQFQWKGRLAVVADGMGGYRGGQQASQIAVQTVREVYEAADGRDLQTALLAGLLTAHERIQEFASRGTDFLVMGTTCTAVSVAGGYLHFAHVGDSRLYLARGGTISRLTRDHSYVNRLIESGFIRAEEADTHPQRHILTAALGIGPDLTTDSPPNPVQLENGDVLVLCTDGLWSLVRDEQLHQAVNTRNPADACQELVKLAKLRGGADNITVQVMRVAG